MKMNTMEKIARALETMQPQIHLDTQLIEKARVGMSRMMAITRGESVQWPAAFNS